jgi:SAM-dependent methyltransferase
VDDLERLYAIRFSDADRARKDGVWSVLCSRFFQRYVPADATVLELGSGYGEFSRHIRARRKIAVDVNPGAGACLPPDVEFHSSTAEDLSAVMSQSVDVCFSSNLFEHLPSKDALDRVLLEARRVLKPGGRYVALQPNLRYAPGEYWDYYDHVLPLTHLSCSEAFAKAGFEVLEVIDRFVPFSTRSRLPQSPWLVRLYLAFPLAWRVLGRQFLIVARKPLGSMRAAGAEATS